MLNDIPEDMIGSRMTAVPNQLFNTLEEDVKKVDKRTAETFHHITAQMLYLRKQARPDVQLGTAFVSTRVRNPDEHNYKKLSHQMKYLQATEHMPLVISGMMGTGQESIAMAPMQCTEI